MNLLLEWLSGGDLRSDGLSNQVVSLVLDHPGLLDELWAGLQHDDDVVRGRAADALEKVARTRPEWFAEHIPELVRVARDDRVPMVCWHLAMLLGHLALDTNQADQIAGALFGLLDDPSVFVRSWAIVGLCIVARRFPAYEGEILAAIAPLRSDPSVAIRTRAGKAIQVLQDTQLPFPAGWVKSVYAGRLLAPSCGTLDSQAGHGY